MLANQPPKLVPLRYGAPYCEFCRDPLEPGMLVGWWRSQRGPRYAVHCAACHRDRVRVLKAQSARGSRAKA